jgi:hypothetical protein
VTAPVDRKLIAFRGHTGRIQLRGLADGGGRRKRKTVEATVAREERAGRGGAKSKLYGEVPWRRRARAGGGATTRRGARVRKLAGESAQSDPLVWRRKRSGRAGGARRERVRRRSALVWRREHSGRVGVRAGHAGR